MRSAVVLFRGVLLCGLGLGLAGCPAPKPEESACPPPGAGSVLHSSETISSNTVWDAKSGPHIIEREVRVKDGATLTIEPCAEVRLGAGAVLRVEGGASSASKLIARGTPERPIRFMRNETNRWSHLEVQYPATAELADLTLEGGGSDLDFSNGTALMIRGDAELPLKRNVLVDHVTIRDAAGHGVWVRQNGGFADGSTDLVVTASGGDKFMQPVKIHSVALSTLPTGSYTGNRKDEILVDTDDVAGGRPGFREDTTIHDRGVPYHVGTWERAIFRVGDAVGSERPAPVTLTIDPGVVLRFEPGASFEVSYGTTDPTNIVGILKAVGTAEKPIVFTSAAEQPAAGDWLGIWFASGVLPQTRLDHVKIEYAGGDCSCSGFTCTPSAHPDMNAAVLIVGGPAPGPFITNTSITNVAGHGIALGWTAAQGASVDFLADGTNRFEGVQGCRQTTIRDENNGCPDPVPCP